MSQRIDIRMVGTGAKLVIVQYAGDFAEAAERLARGGPENYRGQRYTVNFVESLGERLSTATITCVTDHRYRTTTSTGVGAIGLVMTQRINARRLWRALDEERPDLLVIRAPLRTAILWSILRRKPSLIILANSYHLRSLRAWAGMALMVFFTKSKWVTRVANHGRAATAQLQRFGVSASKLSAWDYPAFSSPAQLPAKLRPLNRNLLYAGVISKDKGVVNLLRAVAKLRERQFEVQLRLLGAGDIGGMQRLSRSLGVSDLVTFAGIQPNDVVLREMAHSDVVVVPSRHAFPEGLPLTLYEAYCSRTPLIASDHRMFKESVTHGESGLVFPSGSADTLASLVQELLTDDDMYARLSRGGIAAWESMQVEPKWHVLIDEWLTDQLGKAS